MPAEAFYPPEHERGATRRARMTQAKMICRDCDVLSQCREYALRTAEPHGVWGALTPQERQLLLGQPPRRRGAGA
ncbi:WhiB family transcriptional regulator [Mycobacterium sp. DL440]|uniref:WhiB family transcriptional regulator n=1 Tax=Mycobacterium sp. DL440 TaxID=2675523 RepID=UPI001FB9B4DC|nr:WhiB family transcriptional regulator [Mycobacterium sp. DL440]